MAVTRPRVGVARPPRSSLPRSTCLASDFSSDADHGVGRLLLARPQHHLVAGLGGHLGDARPHDPRTHDAHALDRHGRSSYRRGNSRGPERPSTAARVGAMSGHPRPGRWRRVRRRLHLRSRACSRPAAAAEVLVLPDRARPTSTRAPRRAAASAGSTRSAPRPGASTCSPGPTRSTPANVERARATPASSTSSAARRCTCASVLKDSPGVGRDRRGVARRRGARRLGGRRDGAVRPDGRPAGRRVHARPRAARGHRGDPGPRHWSEDAAHRTLKMSPAKLVLVGIDERTALIRDPDGTWRLRGRRRGRGVPRRASPPTSALPG